MMAKVSAMQRFQDEQYSNWNKVGQALSLVADGLRPFCERVIREFHDSLKENLGDKQCTAKCHAKDIKVRTSDDDDDHVEHDTGTKARWYIDCPDGICNKWLDGIYAGLCEGDQYSWKNTKVKMWPKQPWQLAKIFMGRGQQPSSYNPDKTDVLGLLQLIINCKLFSDCVDRQAAAKVIFCFYYTYVQQLITLQQMEQQVVIYIHIYIYN